MVNLGGGSSSSGSRGRGFSGRQSYLRGSFGRGSLGRTSSSPSMNDDVNNLAPRTTYLDYHLHDEPELTHKRKDKTFVDEKSANIYAAFKTKKLQLSHLSDKSIVVPDDDAIFLEIVGGPNKHGDIYGLRSQSSSFIDKKSSSSASSSTLPQKVSASLMQDFVERSLTDFVLQNEENVGRRIRKAVESRMSPYESALLQMQNLLESLTTTLQGQGFNQRKGIGSNDQDEDFGEDDLNDSD